MLIAFLLGITGSLGHCAGMCSAVILLLQRQPAFQRGAAAWLAVHAGRLTAYAALGALAGWLGEGVRAALPGTQTAQGLLALSLAVTAFFFVLVVMGWAPSPEAALPGLARRWGQAMRAPVRRAPFALGLLWGLLPCGLVIAALFNAAVGAAALTGAARMLAFGAGTLPTLAGVRWLAARGVRAPRALTAAVLALIGVQFAFRGLASFGIVSHLMLGGVALW